MVVIITMKKQKQCNTRDVLNYDSSREADKNDQMTTVKSP